jgi:hypothetical protein
LQFNAFIISPLGFEITAEEKNYIYINEILFLLTNFAYFGETIEIPNPCHPAPIECPIGNPGEVIHLKLKLMFRYLLLKLYIFIKTNPSSVQSLIIEQSLKSRSPPSAKSLLLLIPLLLADEGSGEVFFFENSKLD